jgi:hypothetical protein
MIKLDDKNSEAFGQAVYNIHKTMDISGLSLGVLVENIYLRFQREAERDARDVANGKGII